MSGGERTRGRGHVESELKTLDSRPCVVHARPGIELGWSVLRWGEAGRQRTQDRAGVCVRANTSPITHTRQSTSFSTSTLDEYAPRGSWCGTVGTETSMERRRRGLGLNARTGAREEEEAETGRLSGSSSFLAPAFRPCSSPCPLALHSLHFRFHTRCPAPRPTRRISAACVVLLRPGI